MIGKHVIIDMYGCRNIIDNLESLRQVVIAGVRNSGASILKTTFKQFQPQGVTGVVIVAESHLSIHTWPECEYVALDYFTCGDEVLPEVATDYIIEKIKPVKHTKLVLSRGQDVEIKGK